MVRPHQASLKNIKKWPPKTLFKPGILNKSMPLLKEILKIQGVSFNNTFLTMHIYANFKNIIYFQLSVHEN